MRSIFADSVGTLAALALISLAFAWIVGAHFSLPVLGAAAAAFFRYLPSTLGLLIVSFLIAALVGFLVSLPALRSVRPLIHAGVTALQCIPLFVLAIAIEIPAGFIFGVRSLYIGALVVLTIFQLPLTVAYHDAWLARGLTLRRAARSAAGALARRFDENFPGILSASMITEVIFAWRGEGRLLLAMVAYGPALSVVVFLFLIALLVLLIRTLAGVAARDDDGGEVA